VPRENTEKNTTRHREHPNPSKYPTLTCSPNLDTHLSGKNVYAHGPMGYHQNLGTRLRGLSR
jgi:hypothetical protein